MILVGHSLGGVIAQRVVRRLHRNEYPPYNHTRKIGAVVLFAAPRAGSSWAKRWMPTSEAWQLRIHTRDALDLDEFFKKHVCETITTDDTSPRLPIPLFAGLASRDFWVSEFSASFGIPADQKRTFEGSHTSIVKVKDSAGPVFTWLRQRIDMTQDARKTRDHRTRLVRIPVEFHGRADEHSWDRAYEQALQSAQAEAALQIIDARGAVTGERSLVILRVIRASALDDETVRAAVARDAAKQRSDNRLALGVVLMDPSATASLKPLQDVLGPVPNGASRWTEVASDAYELRRLLHAWLLGAAQRMAGGAAPFGPDDTALARPTNNFAHPGYGGSTIDLGALS